MKLGGVAPAAAKMWGQLAPTAPTVPASLANECATRPASNLNKLLIDLVWPLTTEHWPRAAEREGTEASALS